jgi:hypothetical protein
MFHTPEGAAMKLKTQVEVPTWALLVICASAALGWMAATFFLGRVQSVQTWKVLIDFGYGVAQAAFVGSSAGLFFRYLARGLEKQDESTAAQIARIEGMLENKVAGPFVSRDALPPIKDLIEHSEEFFYVGGNCRSLLQDLPHHFDQWAKEKKKLVFLLQDPDNDGLQSCEMPCANYDYDRYVEATRASIKSLTALSNKGANVELFLTTMTPTQSLAFANPHSPHARVSMFLHLPDGESHTAPCLSFSRSDSPRWYQLFFDRYDALRERSKQVLPPPQSE